MNICCEECILRNKNSDKPMLMDKYICALCGTDLTDILKSIEEAKIDWRRRAEDWENMSTMLKESNEALVKMIRGWAKLISENKLSNCKEIVINSILTFAGMKNEN